MKKIVRGVLIEEAARSLGRLVVCFEHTAPFVLVDVVADVVPNPLILLRSHDVLAKAFEEVARDSPHIVRLGWQMELRRIAKFEKAALRRANIVWTITEADATEYEKRYGHTVDGVMGVYVDSGKYHGVSAGDPNVVLHLGGFDARKRHGLVRFVEEIWPRVRKRVPAANLYLGGEGSERMHAPQLGVTGVGRVESEIEFLGRGTVFVNPQISGAGIKLKSVNALAAKKVLVSTRNGLSGIVGENGRDFLAYERPDEGAALLTTALKDALLRERIASAGHALVVNHFSRRNFEQSAERLLTVVEAWVSRT